MWPIDFLVYRWRATSESYISHLKKMGATIGDDVTIHVPHDTLIDETAAHLLTIGNHVNITGPATILTHDYSWSVIKGKTGEILGNQKPVVIEDNVFVGWGATILCGTHIEANTVVGAHSVVSGRIEGNSVWAGVPAKRICSLEDYREKRKASQIEEAQEFVRSYRQKFGSDPEEKHLREYFFLFANEINQDFEYQMKLMGTWEKSLSVFDEGDKPFEDFQAFLDSVD